MNTTKAGWLAGLLLTAFGCAPAGSELDACADCPGSVGSELVTTNDLTVQYIQRQPLLNWVENSANPTREGWPAIGQSVTWRGFIKNFSSLARSNVRYEWRWDNTLVKSGTFNIAANGVATVTYPRNWDFSRHNLRLAIDTTNLVSENEEQNNSLTVVSNAINVGFWVEQGTYDHFKNHQRDLVGAKSTCFENWAQRQITRANALFQAAVTPDTPSGVLDRLRLDKIVIVPNGALPLNGGLATNHPDVNDHTVDLEWGFPASIIADRYGDLTTVNDDNPFYNEPSLLHELGHARYLLDNYSLNVHENVEGTLRDHIPHTEGGGRVVGTPYLPMINGDVVYYTHQTGLMDTDYSRVDTYSAMALNLIAGRRAVQGNSNAPGNFAAFRHDLPSENRITLLDDATGAPLAGAVVRIYRAGSTNPPELYAKQFSTSVAMTLTANANGQILVGRNPFTGGPTIELEESQVMLLRVSHQNRVRYTFMESTDFNMEVWRGHSSLGLHTLRVAFLPGATESTGPTCATPYSQSNCLVYQAGNQVSSGGHNWTCTTGNCRNCATHTSCAPGGSGCPWGVVWSDNGTCQ